MNRVLVTKEIASSLGCSEDTVRRMYRTGKLPGAFKLSSRGSPVKISQTDLQKFIHARRTQGG